MKKYKFIVYFARASVNCYM